MPTNVFSGRSAFIGVAATSSGTATALGALQGFTLTVDASLIDVVHQDTSNWIERFPGHASWTLTSDNMIFSTAATQEQDTLRGALSSATRQYFTIQNSTDSTGDSSWFQRGYGYVTGWTWTGDQTSPQVHNFSVSGDGALTEGTS
jgi:predicted secreted protein